jgi:nucleoid DNA-binding protein
MKKEQVAKQLAKESRISAAAAADQVDRILSDILKRVRKGQAASLPGLGTFRSGDDQEFRFDRKILENLEAAKPGKKTP